jgi:hypothetical protein
MRPVKILALAALAAPAVALAQPTYYLRESPLVREELRLCMDRDQALAQRDADAAAEKRLNDREGDAIARASARLAEDLRRLDSADALAVAAHNARASEHNRRVEAHNLRVYDQNSAAAQLNRDQADMSATCGARTYYRRDRDAILWERGALR